MGNEIDRQYSELLEHIIRFGVDKTDRTGTGTKSIFGWQIRHNMQNGFPALTTKKLAWKQVCSELLWFLTGQTNISFLLKHNNHIWDGDAYKNYAAKTSLDADEQLTKEEFIEKVKTDKDFAKQWGNLGPIYGKQWRKWESEVVEYSGMKYEREPIDQIDNLVKELKTNPNSRRLMVSAWNVGQLDQMILPPCHYGFQCYVRDGKYLSLMWNQRSVDTFLGLPFNIASYGLLLHILANECGMIPDELIGNLGDVHLYSNHIEQAKEQLSRTPYDLPTLKTEVKIDGICCATPDDFILEGYQHHPTIKAPLSN
jgi:thymidylate synthase